MEAILLAERDGIEAVDEVIISRPPRVFLVFVAILLSPAVLWNKIRRRAFSRFEQALIAQLNLRLPPDQTVILQSQLREVNFVNRVCYNTKSEAVLFKVRPWGPDRRRSKQFAFTERTVILATLTALLDGKNCRIDFVCCDGVLSMIEFDFDIRGFAKFSEFVVTDVDITAQPLDDFGRALD